MVKGVEFLLEQERRHARSPARRRSSRRSSSACAARRDRSTRRNVIIATGARPRTLPGLETDGETIINSREALALREQPEKVVIIGGGPIGVEFAQFWRAYGVDVTILEVLDHLLPLEDEEISVQLERAYKKQGIKFVTGAQVAGATARERPRDRRRSRRRARSSSSMPTRCSSASASRRTSRRSASRRSA